MIGQALHDVIGVKQRLSDNPPDMVVLRQVEDLGALSTGAHQVAEAELGQPYMPISTKQVATSR